MELRLIDKIAKKLGFINQSELPRILGSWITSTGAVQTSEKSYAQLVDAYKSWVYTSVDKIAKSVAMIPLNLYIYRDAKGKKIEDPGFKHYYKSIKGASEKRYYLKQVGLKKEQINKHPFLDLIYHPNNLMTRFMLWYETMIKLEIGGMCGWYVPANGLKIPSRIWPLPLTRTATLKPRVKATVEIEGWDYRDGEVNQTFQTSEILMIKYPHPASPFMSMSPLMAQTYPYDIDLFLMQQQRAFFDNMAMPGLHLTTDQKLNPNQVKEIVDQITEQYSTAIKAGKTLVTHSGLKKEPITSTAREAMVDKIGKFARDKLITSYDLSPGKLGLVEDVNRANGEFLDETYVGECLRPKCMMVEEVLEEFLLPRYDRGLTCDFELPDFSDKELRLKERNQNLNTFYTSVNEERIMDGREPAPWGDTPWIPFNYTQSPGAVPSNGKPAKEVKLMGREYWTEDRKVVLWKMFVARVDHYKILIDAPMKRHFKNMAEEVIRRLDESGKKILGKYSGWSRKKVEATLKSDEAVGKINIDREEDAKKLAAEIEPIDRYIMHDVGTARLKDLIETAKISVNFNVNDPRVLEWLGQRMRKFSEEVSGTSFDAIEKILQEGFAEGLPIATIAETLRSKFNSWDQYRAEMIAQTETIAAMNQADLEAARQSGMESALLKHWLSARDANVRESHQIADREYDDGIPIDEPFVVGQDSMDAPCEGVDPSENINCRCTLYYTEKTEG
jgi:phage portal protein BeeE